VDLQNPTGSLLFSTLHLGEIIWSPLGKMNACQQDPFLPL
jgi:hypothetical protein